MTSRSKASASPNWPRLMARLARARSNAICLERSDGSGLARGRLDRRARTTWRSMTSATTRAQRVGRDRLGEEIDRAQLHGRDGLGDAAVAVRITTGMMLPSARSWRSSSMPSILGISRSSRMRSQRGSTSRRRSSAAWPSRGLDHLVADRFQRGPSMSRTFGSSSTIRMRFC